MTQKATQGAKWTGYFKFVTPQPTLTKMTDSQEMADAGAYNNYTWYQRLIQGSASRMTRYREYDLMDNHIDVYRALDTIAEEITGNNTKSDEPLDIFLTTVEEKRPESSTVLTLRAAIRRWFKVMEFESKLFSIVRMTVKYGDVFFRRGKTVWDKWLFIHPKNVLAAIVDQNDVTKIVGWQIKKDVQRVQSGSYGLPLNAKQDTQYESEIVSAKEIIRFTLADDMNDTLPFGDSVLRPVYRTHKQMELLEDAILIYRIQRAPERRVFYIDVGKMPPQRVKTYLEGIKNEIKQKRVPTINGGQSEIDTVYNPHSMSEDFFFACISLKTKVFLLDGRIITLDDARKEYEEGKENWTCSIDQETGEKIEGKIAWAGYTRKDADLLRVHFNNDEFIDCTPDHKFVLDNGDECEAQYLTEETKLSCYNEQVDITEVEVLPYKENTGCLYVEDPGENHNFALAAGVYVKNSRPDGRGSKVDTLPGGQGLGELADLEYFQRKVWRGLRIPTSYMQEQDGGGAMINDGKVGMAYIQELRFALFISRLQISVEKTLDYEFKRFISSSSVKIDEETYEVRLPEPSNFGKYRQLELDTQLLGAYSSADGIMHLSKRFSMSRFLQMSHEDIIKNERMKAEELGLNPDDGDKNYAQIYASEAAGGEMGMGGGMGGGFMGGGMEGGMEGMGAEGEAGGAGAEGAAGGAPEAGGAPGA